MGSEPALDQARMKAFVHKVRGTHIRQYRTGP
jgi:hypothetical protein